MPAKVPFPIKFKPLFKGVHFVLKDTAGKLIDDKIFPYCSDFTGHIVYDTFAVCSALLSGAGKRYGVLEVVGLNNRVLERVEFDNQLYCNWLKKNK